MPEQDNFEPLRRLLAVKRYELPPPAYFDRLSVGIIARIGAETTSHPQTLKERLFSEAPWIEQLWSSFQQRPIFAGACSFAVCGLIVAAIAISDTVGSPGLGTMAGPQIAEAAPWLNQNSASALTKAAFVGFANSNSLPTPGLPTGSLFEEVHSTHPFPAHAKAVNWTPQ